MKEVLYKIKKDSSLLFKDHLFIEKYIELIDDPNNKVIDGTYKLSELQAKAILDLRLQRLTGLESEKITLEINELSDNINQYLSIISDNDVLKKLIIFCCLEP